VYCQNNGFSQIAQCNKRPFITRIAIRQFRLFRIALVAGVRDVKRVNRSICRQVTKNLDQTYYVIQHSTEL